MDILHYAFMQRALVAALIAGVLCSVLGVYIVLKRLSFIGAGISHSAFGGVALGYLLGLNPITTAIPFTIAIAAAIGAVSRKGRVSEDVAIGIFFTTAMALGVVFVGLAHGYNVDLFGYLFGSILAVSASDLVMMGILCCVVLGIVALLFKELYFVSFDEEMAKVSGLPVEKLYYLLLCLIAITVVISVKIIGIVLVAALLVIPAATAFQLTSNFRWMMLISALLGAFCGVQGLFLSYYFNLPSGATIVLTATAIFLLCLALSPKRRHKLSQGSKG
jgi:ABC-type Mn2+/Zn2+ transport system permease subunit